MACFHERALASHTNALQVPEAPQRTTKQDTGRCCIPSLFSKLLLEDQVKIASSSTQFPVSNTGDTCASLKMCLRSRPAISLEFGFHDKSRWSFMICCKAPKMRPRFKLPSLQRQSSFALSDDMERGSGLFAHWSFMPVDIQKQTVHCESWFLVPFLTLNFCGEVCN